jgi:hypothetical protein
LALQNDARCYAVIARETLSIAELRAAIRERTAATLGEASWQTLDEEVDEFTGTAIMVGLAEKLLRRYADTPERFLLLDCLLQLAPGYVQVMAALMEKWFEPGSGSGFNQSGSDPEPSVGAIGGMADSCYIWRSGGPMSDSRGPK